MLKIFKNTVLNHSVYLYKPTRTTLNNTAKQLFTPQSQCPTKQRYGSCLVNADTAIITGGIENNSILNHTIVMSKDPFGNWKQGFNNLQRKANMLRPIAGHSQIYTSTNDLLIFGGITTTEKSNEYHLVKQVSCYSILNDSWLNLSRELIEARQEHSATYMQDKSVLISGGIDYDEFSVKKTCEIYNHLSGLCDSVAPLNIARAGHQSMLLPNGNVLVYGGFTKSHGTCFYLDEHAEEYIVEQDCWRELSIKIAAPPSTAVQYFYVV